MNRYPVDLIGEFHNWRFGGEFLREPLKVYSLEDIRAVFEKHKDAFGLNFSLSGLEQGAPNSVSKPEHMPDEEYRAEISGVILKHVFKEAIDKLVQTTTVKAGVCLA